jgi:hypothetical protein
MVAPDGERVQVADVHAQPVSRCSRKRLMRRRKCCPLRSCLGCVLH